MAELRRVQLSWSKIRRTPPNTKNCDHSTKWGNPFKPGVTLYGMRARNARHAANLYLGFAPGNETLVRAAREELAGFNLACWCKLCDLHTQGKPLSADCPYCDRCHVDTLGKLANGYGLNAQFGQSPNKPLARYLVAS